MAFDSLLFSVTFSHPPLKTADTTAPTPVPSFQQTFLDDLIGIELESAWNGIIDDWDAASDDEAMAARHFIGTVRDRVVEGVSDTTDIFEFQTAALLAFTRLKAFWFELNSRLGHHLTAETMDNSLPLRAGLIAALLGTMEPHLCPRSVEKVDAFLSAVVADEVENDSLMGSRLLPGPVEVRRKIANLLGTVETLSERVVKQEGELIELRSGTTELQNVFGANVSARDIAEKMKKLSATVTALEAQADMEDVYREVLGQALGTTDPLEVVKEVRRLREAAKEQTDVMFRAQLENARITAQFGDAMTPTDALEQLRDAERATLAARRETDALQVRLAAQAERAEAVTRERDRLLHLLGVATLDEAQSAVQTLRENETAYNEIAGLLGNVGAELGKLG